MSPARYTPLIFSRHRNLRLIDAPDFRFAAKETLIPFIIDEVADIAREYPIVFPDNGSQLPCALVGVEREANAYVSADGQWRARYVPGHVRRHPFFLGKVPDTAENPQPANATEYVVLIDQTSPLLSETEGERIYTESGELQPVAERRTKLLKRIQQRMPVTRNLVQLLESYGLLKGHEITFSKAGEPKRVVRGVRFVDGERLKSLPADAVYDLFTKGAFPLIYAHGISLANLRWGPLAGFGIKPFEEEAQIEDMLNSDLIRFDSFK